MNKSHYLKSRTRLVSKVSAAVLLGGAAHLAGAAEEMLLQEDFSQSSPRRIEEGGNTPLLFKVVEEDTFRKEHDAPLTGTVNRALLFKGTEASVLFEGLGDFELTLRVNYVRRSPADTIGNFEPDEIKIDLGGAFRYHLDGTLQVKKTDETQTVQGKATDVFGIPTAGADQEAAAIQTVQCEEAALTNKWEWKWLKFAVTGNQLRVFTSPTGNFANDAILCAEATTDQPLTGTITLDIKHYPVETTVLIDDITLTGNVPAFDATGQNVASLAGNLRRGLYYTKGGEAAIRMISAAQLGQLGPAAAEALPNLVWRHFVSVDKGKESASLGEQLVLENAIRHIDPEVEPLSTLIDALSSNQPEFRRVIVDALVTGTWQRKWWERLEKSKERELVRARDPEALVQYSSALVDLLGNPDPGVRWSTLDLLEKIGEEHADKVMTELVKALENDRSGSVKAAEQATRTASALQALVEHDALLYGWSPELAWRLLNEAAQSGNAGIRAAAITALAELYAKVNEQRQQMITKPIARGLGDTDAAVRANAVRAVQTAWNAGAPIADMIGDLQSMLKDADAEIRRAATLTIGSLGATSQIDDVELVNNKPVWKTRNRLAAAAADSVPPLLRNLQDKSPGVRAASAEALGRIMDGTGRVLAASLDLLKDGKADTAKEAGASSHIKGVSLSDFSSQYEAYADHRAIHAIDGSGLKSTPAGVSHTLSLSGTVWMATKLPAQITVDLGGYYKLERLHVWNFLHPQKPGRAAKAVEIWVAPEPDLMFVPESESAFVQLDGDLKAEGIQPFTFDKPSSEAHDGQSIDLAGNPAAKVVRRVRLVIVSNYGDPNSSGLAEVRFEGNVLPERIKALQQRREQVEREHAMVVEGLLRRLQEDANLNARREAAIALARIGVTEQASGLALTEAVEDQDDAAVRSAALRALGAMKLAEAMPVFKQHLADESGPVRDAAAAGLLKLGVNPQDMESYKHKIELGLRKAREQLSPDPMTFGGYTLTPFAVLYARPFEYEGGLEKANALLAAYCRYQTEYGRGARQADTQLFGAYLHEETKALLTDEVRAAIENYAWTQAPRRKALAQAELGFSDVGGSENWTLIDHTRTYLALLVLARSERYGPEVEVEGKPVAYHIKKWTDFWMRFVKDRATRSLDLEINTKGSYASITFNSYHDLYTLTPSPALRELIGDFLILYFAEEAVTGGAIASTRRSNIATPDGFWAEMFLKAYGWNGWSTELNFPYYLGMAGSSVFADYRIPEVVPAIARDKDRGCYLVKSRRDGIGNKADPSWVRRDVYYTPDYTLGTLTYDPTKPYVNVIRIAQLMGADFPTANDYIVAGPHGGHYGSMALSGITGTNVSAIARPVNAAFGDKQFSSTGIQIYFSRKGELYKTHVADDSGWHFFQTGDAFAAVRVAGEKTKMREERDSASLVPEDIWAPIVIQMGRKPDYESFDAFQAAVRDNRFTLENDLLTYESEAGDVYEYPRKSESMPRINSQTVNTDPEPGDKIIDSPFVTMIHGEDKATITYPGHEPLVLDFSR